MDQFHVELMVSENNNLKHKISNLTAEYFLVELRYGSVKESCTTIVYIVPQLEHNRSSYITFTTRALSMLDLIGQSLNAYAALLDEHPESSH